MKERLGFNFFDVFVVLFCVAFALLCFYPLWYVFVVSITPYEVFIKTPLVLLPPLKPDLHYYAGILAAESFRNAFVISVLVTALGTALAVMVSSAMAYAVSKEEIKGMKFLNTLAVITMFFSGGLIPTFFLYKNIGLLGSFWAMVLPGGFAVGQFVIIRNYFSYSVPKELEESARIDGANDILIFFRIVIPLAKPMLAAISLFIAVGYWNDYYTYMVFIGNKPALQPLMYALRRMLYEGNFGQAIQHGAEQLLGLTKVPAFSLRMATIICSIVPILIVYPFLQKHFAKGILIGAVKG